MSRFGRNQSFIASHFTHGFPGSPRAFHQIEPLTWGTYMAYGGTPYGLSTSWVADGIAIRFTRSDLESRKATVNVYELWDAVQKALDVKPGKAAETYPSFSGFTALAATNAAALLKTAYWLAVAGTALGNSVLVTAARERANAGLKSGILKDSVYQTNYIARTYADALELLQKHYTSNMYSGTAATALAQLQKASPVAVQDRVLEAKTTAAEAKARQAQADKEQAEKEAKEKAEKEEQDKPPPCANTWKAYIPGYCAAEQAGEMAALAAKIAGGVLVAGVAIWGVKRLIKQAKSNPEHLRRQLTLENPSAPGNMTDEPEAEIAAMPKGRRQEQNLAKTAFLRRSR